MAKQNNSATTSDVEKLLELLNKQYLRVHQQYERLFWTSYMGDHSVDTKFARAQEAREKFRTDNKLAERVDMALLTARKDERVRLQYWKNFFSKYQTPIKAKATFSKIVNLEKKIHKKLASRKEGYIDPTTKKFVKASRAQMREIMSTHDNEKIRKACFTALEELALLCVEDLIVLINLRNEYAKTLGYDDFYAYKLMTEEGMTKKELFSIFDTIYDKTKYAFKTLREMEKTQPGLRKPWNKGYMLAGDFTKESDQYYPFDQALERWGRSFAALGIRFHGDTLQLDLLDRDGKYENGFCHWPTIVHYKNGVRQSGAANFTCNVVYGQVGSAEEAYVTLFHEGGHAAHYLNSQQTEVCINNEYPPASTAWAETQSMFLDSMLSSVEWTMRYAKNDQGETYPWDLFEREVKKLSPLSPLAMNGIASVMEFERRLYESQKLSKARIIKLARETHTKYTDAAVPSNLLLSVPHIYSWESSCSYHGYGLATLAVSQWREHFYKKYGYIVDNIKVGKDMAKMWALASSKTFPECIKLATGKKLSPQAFLSGRTASTNSILKKAKQKIARLEKVRPYTKEIDLNANIKMVHGKKTIATNKKSFADMTQKYAQWLKKQHVNKVN